jgi:hypothetical protein
MDLLEVEIYHGKMTIFNAAYIDCKCNALGLILFSYQ